MEARVCMNAACVSSATWTELKNGWPLRSGGFVTLCNKCSSAYDEFVFCEVFHSNESGWRQCSSCGKRLHCGCIASLSFIQLLDDGGVNCVSCPKQSGLNPINDSDKPNEFGLLKVDDLSKLHPLAEESQLGETRVDETVVLKLGTSKAQNMGLKNLSLGKIKQEEVLSPGDTRMQQQVYEPIAHTNLSISLGPSGNPNIFHGGVPDESDNKPLSIFQQLAPKSRQFLLPKPPRTDIATCLEPNATMLPHIRVARPPAEGRGKTQLLPRYWPRITDQELQKISGDSNSTIVPLFEKVLSASDAGRIGRLVLPKACAEAYFPPISQPEGLPLRIQDIKGKEWMFQFRFWPNNNSRMYVLEGVTPCIQSMQLQAGDTVTFSRMDPEGKLLMGFRKATNSAAVQDTPPFAVPSVTHSSESFFSGVFENLPITSGYYGLIQSLKGSNDHLSVLSKHLNSAGSAMYWHKFEKHEDLTKERLLLQSMLGPDRKRTRNIGSKNKRLLIDSLDALELKLTWEEVQELLRPPPSAFPSIITIEDQEFEEYNEPPVFGKSSVFIMRSTGGQEQWVQCDSCSKWRRLPIDALLPSKWTCAENTWDQSRSTCTVPDELTPRELETLLRLNKEFKRKRTASSDRNMQEYESSDLPSIRITRDNVGESGTPSAAATTKHPRHRPGCSCIVCIQPPSGKGKHKPTCTCNVCMTVKRRFKTLMMNKKKRQSEREAEIVQRNQHASGPREEREVDAVSQHLSSLVDSSDNEARSGNGLESSKLTETGTGHIDLNCQPDRGEVSRMGFNRISMMSLLQVANLPLEMYLRQNGLTSLVTEQQEASPTYETQAQECREPKRPVNEHCFVSENADVENGNGENREPGSDQNQNDPL